MFRTISPELKAHLALPTTTVAFAIRVTRSDSVVMGFTTHVRSVTIDAQLYKASTAVMPTSIESKVSTGIDNQEFLGAISSVDVTEDDILQGRYDHARVSVFLFNYKDLTMGSVLLLVGKLGEVKLNGINGFRAEVRGLLVQARQRIGDVLSATCRVHKFADAECGLNRATFVVTGAVDNVISRQTFQSSDLVALEPDGYYDFGEFVWLTGDNAGVPNPDVLAYVSATGQIELMSEMRKPIQVGDTFEVVAGCNRLFDTCRDKFSNTINYAGEPHVPGRDYLVQILD